MQDVTHSVANAADEEQSMLSTVGEDADGEDSDVEDCVARLAHEKTADGAVDESSPDTVIPESRRACNFQSQDLNWHTRPIPFTRAGNTSASCLDDLRGGNRVAR